MHKTHITKLRVEIIAPENAKKTFVRITKTKSQIESQCNLL